MSAVGIKGFLSERSTEGSRQMYRNSLKWFAASVGTDLEGLDAYIVECQAGFDPTTKGLAGPQSNPD